MKLSESGLAWHERFSFYDQVHTTGMDIKQCADACAALTLGKDMVFRDYAQGNDLHIIAFVSISCAK